MHNTIKKKIFYKIWLFYLDAKIIIQDKPELYKILKQKSSQYIKQKSRQTFNQIVSKRTW